MRRRFAMIGLAVCVVAFVAWAATFLGPMLDQTVRRYEFGAPEGAEVLVREGKLEIKGTHWVAGPLKLPTEVATVVILFLVAMTACILLLRQPREVG
jgi:hypothetical protein